MVVSIIDYGAAIQSVLVKGKNGEMEVCINNNRNRQEVTLNYNNIDDLLANAGVFNGATVGRYYIRENVKQIC